MSLTRYEMETQINFNAEESTAEIYTRDKSVMLKLDRLVAAHPDVYSLIKSDDWGKTYSCPKRLIGFRKPASEKAKEAARQNALKMQVQRRENEKEND